MEEVRLKWLFRGKIFVPVDNPLRADKPPDDDGTCIWLGPGLKLLLDHVLTVDALGIIQHLEPASGFFNKRVAVEQEFIVLGEHEFLCPGFIDLHIHAPQFSYAGTATDRPLMGPDGWLETYTFPAERRLGEDLHHAKSVYDAVVRAALKNGTTTAVYFATLDAQPCKILVDSALSLGQRALIGKVCMDRNSPEGYCQTLEQNVVGAKQVIDYIYDKVGRRSLDDQVRLPLILPLITPRFIPTCTPELMTALGMLAKEHLCHITSHISESTDEVEWSRNLDAAKRTGAFVFDEYRLLTNQCIMAHAVHLTDEDCKLLRDRGTAVAHCPLSNFFFAGGILPCRRLLEMNNLVGLGTDISGGYSPSILHSAQMAVVSSRAILDTKEESTRLDYRHGLYLATLGGAKSLGLDKQLGTFRVGMEFDAIVLSASSNIYISDRDTASDIFQKVCVQGDDRNVTRVFVQGEDATIRS